MGGQGWHVTPRLRAEEEKHLSGAVPFRSTSNNQEQRSTARARTKLECYAFSRETASAGAHALASHAAAGFAFEAAAGMSHHGRAPTEKGFSRRSSAQA